MTVLMGTKRSTFGATTYGYGEGTLQSGKVYEAVYPVTGIGTLIPGWENDAITRVYTILGQQNCTPTYLEVNGDLLSPHSVTVQFTYNGTTSTSAVIAPAVWVVIELLLVAGIIVWLTLTLPSTIKAIGSSVTDNPEFKLMIYGALGILGLMAITNFMSERRRGRESGDTS